MSAVQLRPTFRIDTELEASEVTRCVQETFARDDGETTYHSQFSRGHAMISIDESQRQFWSPWMHLEFREGDSGRQIHGRFSPHPSIWTGFMFAYGALAVLIFFAIMFGVSQQLSGQSPWGYVIIPVCLFIAALLWLASRTGQKLAQDEMLAMKSRLEDCVGK